MRAPYLICKGFVDAQWDVDIVTSANVANASLDFAWQNVPVRKIDGRSKREKLLKLAKSLFGRRKDHVVISWVWDWHCFALVAAKLMWGANYCIVLDTYSHRAFGSVRDKLWQEIRYGLVLRNASLILAEAPVCQQSLQKHMRKPQVLLVPSCLWQKDLTAIEAKWAANGPEPARKPLILYAGRLLERKNVHILIDAFARLADQYPDWTLELVGPTTSTAYVTSLQEQVRRHKLEKRIHFLPSLSGEALYHKYRESSIYALPSSGEGFPTSILEAMYFGGAILAGNSGFVAYQLDEGRCGLLHRPGDLETLTTHLDQLMVSTAQRVNLMESARQRMSRMFLWEQYFSNLEQAFRELI